MSTERSRQNLHELLKRRSFEHALLTTFSFRPDFFENYALENFRAFESNGNISVLVDAGTYRELISDGQADAEAIPRLANLRYLLHPVEVPGVFHPKVFFFADKSRGLLVIGSANFTQDGLGSNAELVSTFEFEEGKSEGSLPLFQQAFELFEQIGSRWPSEQLRSNLDTIRSEVPWLMQTASGPPDPKLPILISNTNEALWPQLMRRLPTPARRVSVLSRYLDANPDRLDEVLNATAEGQLTIWTQNGLTTMSRSWLEHPAFAKKRLKVQLCTYADDEHPQPLHAKGYFFDCGEKAVMAMGSANFSTSAMFRTAGSGNFEVLLVYPPMVNRASLVSQLFDPSGTARQIQVPSDLTVATTGNEDTKSPAITKPIRIDEAFVEERYLRLKCASDEPISDKIRCRLVRANERAVLLDGKLEKEVFSVSCDDGLLRRLRGGSSIVEVGVGEATKWESLSNALLVTNLQDLETGEDIQKARQFREARESPQKFIDVLNALSRGDDEERLKQFLTYCNIPLDLPPRFYHGRRKTTRKPDDGDAMRQLGMRNLKYFELLHDAVVDFVRRHQRRLDRHVEHGTAQGIPNYLHILLTTVNLLLSQIQRLSVGLSGIERVEMKPDDWKNVREYLGVYYSLLRHLLETTAVNYVTAMTKDGLRPQLKQAFEDATAPDELHAIFEKALAARDALDSLRQERLYIVTIMGSVKGPSFFDSILAVQKWQAYGKVIRGLEERLVREIAA